MGVPLRPVCVQSALPGLLDQQEITAALRQCNYDPEEVVSLFGEILLQAPPSGEPTSSELDSFRSGADSGSSLGRAQHLGFFNPAGPSWSGTGSSRS